MKPIYSRLGSHDLLKKCLGGYTHSTNEALHQLVWKFCPKILFLGTAAVKCGASLAVCHFNDGVSSFYSLAESLGCEPSTVSQSVLVKRDKHSMARSIYKDSDRAKTLRKQCRKRRKGIENQKREEGLMYMPGMDGIDNTYSKHQKRA